MEVVTGGVGEEGVPVRLSAGPDSYLSYLCYLLFNRI